MITGDLHMRKITDILTVAVYLLTAVAWAWAVGILPLPAL
jgi:hypothetical protein